MNRRVVIDGVRLDRVANSPTMRLRESDSPHRAFDIFIGAPEAASIHSALEGTETPRPLTHDLFVIALERLEVSISQVVITEVVDGTFYAELTLSSPRGETVVSCRPSDGVAIALRSDAPIYASDALIAEVGEEDSEAQEAVILEEFKDFIDNIKPEDFG